MIDTNVFSKGTYIVVLADCCGGNNWTAIPTNHIYKLREDSHTFKILLEKDTMGSTTNGWTAAASCSLDKMKLRKATLEEIAAYERYGPCNIEKAKKFIFEYEIY